MRYLLLLLLIVLPLAANAQLRDVVCLGQHDRTSISRKYLANIHRLAAMVQSKTSSLPGLSTDHEVGEYPDTVYAFSRCHNGTNSTSCRACIILALQEARRACPDHKESVFFNGNCSLRLYGVHFYLNNMDDAIVFITSPEKRNVVMSNLYLTMVFQAIGFAWLFFLLLQDCREKKTGSPMKMKGSYAGVHALSHLETSI